MKVAVLLTGHLRSAADNVGSLQKHLLSHYDCDIYCSTWGGEVERNTIKSLYKDNLKNFYIGDANKYSQITKQLTHEDGDFAYTAWWANRLRDQWFIMKQGYDLIDGEYDAIVRIRFDLQLQDKLEITTESLVLPDDPEGRAKHKVDERATDHIAFGSCAQMATYCSLHDHFNDLIPVVDVSFAEGLVVFYNRELHKLPVEIKLLEYRINNHLNHDFKSFDGTSYIDQVKFK